MGFCGVGHGQSVLFVGGQYGKAFKVLRESAIDESLIDLNNGAQFEPNENLRLNSVYRPFAASIGMLDFEAVDIKTGKVRSWHCTAAIISPDYIMTNNHCLPQDGLKERDNSIYRIRSAHLRLGFENIEQLGERFSVDPIPVETDKNLDYSIARVQGNPAKKYGSIPLTIRNPKRGERLFIIHHPDGMPKQISKNCGFKGIYDNTLMHYCDTLGGSSGSPIFSDEDFSLVGLHYAGVPGDREYDRYNSSKPMTNILKHSKLLSALANASEKKRSKQKQFTIPDGDFSIMDMPLYKDMLKKIDTRKTSKQDIDQDKPNNFKRKKASIPKDKTQYFLKRSKTAPEWFIYGTKKEPTMDDFLREENWLVVEKSQWELLKEDKVFYNRNRNIFQKAKPHDLNPNIYTLTYERPRLSAYITCNKRGKKPAFLISGIYGAFLDSEAVSKSEFSYHPYFSISQMGNDLVITPLENGPSFRLNNFLSLACNKFHHFKFEPLE